MIIRQLDNHIQEYRAAVEMDMMISDSNSTYAADLRFALEVMEECSCLGLDSAYATKLGSVMLRQMERAEADQARTAEHSESVPV